MTPQILPARLSIVDLARLWRLSEARVGQFIKAGKLIRGADGKIDRDEALKFRAAQMDEQQVNVLFQYYGNKHGTYAPKIVEHTEAELTDWQILGIDPPPAEATQATLMTEALRRQNTLADLKQEDLRHKIELQKRRALREAGELVERTTVYRHMQDAAATIQNLLRTLEHEIPSIFADQATRSDVRRKVEQIVDRCLHAMTKKIEKYENGDAPREEQAND